MKTAEDKAMEWVNKHMHHGYNRMVRSLAILLIEQDRDTRHACAESVLEKNSIAGECSADSIMFRSDAHAAVMNTKAI